MTAAYTTACVSAAREHADFVMGFISQRSLNSAASDGFVSFTPGVNLPPEGEGEDGDEGDGGVEGDEGRAGGKWKGDGLGQQYRSPRTVVLGEGCDVVIVGRGILGVRDRRGEAERYRREAWRAYVERVGGRRRR